MLKVEVQGKAVGEMMILMCPLGPVSSSESVWDEPAEDIPERKEYRLYVYLVDDDNDWLNVDNVVTPYI